MFFVRNCDGESYDLENAKISFLLNVRIGTEFEFNDIYKICSHMFEGNYVTFTECCAPRDRHWYRAGLSLLICFVTHIVYVGVKINEVPTTTDLYRDIMRYITDKGFNEGLCSYLSDISCYRHSEENKWINLNLERTSTHPVVRTKAQMCLGMYESELSGVFSLMIHILEQYFDPSEVSNFAKHQIVLECEEISSKKEQVLWDIKYHSDELQKIIDQTVIDKAISKEDTALDNNVNLYMLSEETAPLPEDNVIEPDKTANKICNIVSRAKSVCGNNYSAEYHITELEEAKNKFLNVYPKTVSYAEIFDSWKQFKKSEDDQLEECEVAEPELTKAVPFSDICDNSRVKSDCSSFTKFVKRHRGFIVILVLFLCFGLFTIQSIDSHPKAKQGQLAMEEAVLPSEFAADNNAVYEAEEKLAEGKKSAIEKEETIIPILEMNTNHLIIFVGRKH